MKVYTPNQYILQSYCPRVLGFKSVYNDFYNYLDTPDHPVTGDVDKDKTRALCMTVRAFFEEPNSSSRKLLKVYNDECKHLKVKTHGKSIAQGWNVFQKALPRLQEMLSGYSKIYANVEARERIGNTQSQIGYSIDAMLLDAERDSIDIVVIDKLKSVNKSCAVTNSLTANLAYDFARIAELPIGRIITMSVSPDGITSEVIHHSERLQEYMGNNDLQLNKKVDMFRCNGCTYNGDCTVVDKV